MTKIHHYLMKNLSIDIYLIRINGFLRINELSPLVTKNRIKFDYRATNTKKTRFNELSFGLLRNFLNRAYLPRSYRHLRYPISHSCATPRTRATTFHRPFAAFFSQSFRALLLFDRTQSQSGRLHLRKLIQG
jgi:hypothetical protein